MSVRQLQRTVAKVLDRMSPVQRDVADDLIAGDGPGDDEVLAERHGMTPGAVRIERAQARRILQEALGPGLAHVW